MGDANEKTAPALTEGRILAAYDHAAEVVYHNDVLMWEVTSIIWGANTLLLGFILEAISEQQARPLIIVTSVIGIFLTGLVAQFLRISKTSQSVAYEMCHKIEDEQFPKGFRVHRSIEEKFANPESRRWFFGIMRGKAQSWMRLITVIFLVAWGFTLFWAVFLQLRECTGR